MKIPIPKSPHDKSYMVMTESMCASCAYRSPLTHQEIECELSARKERGGAHYCHERNNHVCFGSMMLQKKLENVI